MFSLPPLSPLPRHEKAATEKEEEQYAGGVLSGHHPEGGSIAPMLGHHSTQKAAYAKAEIPAGEDARVGGATLVVASHRHEHVEKSGVKMAIAKAYEHGGQVVGHRVWHGDEEDEAHKRQAHALGGIVGELAVAQRLAALQAREKQATGEYGEIGSRATRHAKLFLAVDGEIIAERAPAEAEHGNVDGQEPGAREEEAVERYLALVFHDFLIWHAQRAGYRHGHPRHGQGYPEQRGIAAHGIVEPDAHRRGYGHGEIVAQPVKPDALVATRSGQHVDGAGAVGHRHRAEGRAVERAANGEHENGASCDVASEAHEESRETQHEHLLAREAVDDVTAKGTHDERSHGVAAQHDAYHVFSGPKLLAEIQRQQRGEEIECKIKQEVGRHHLDVVGVPKSLGVESACLCHFLYVLS